MNKALQGIDICPVCGGPMILGEITCGGTCNAELQKRGILGGGLCCSTPEPTYFSPAKPTHSKEYKEES